MKEERILHALGAVDERYIAEAIPHKKRHPLRWVAAAACLALVVYAGIRYIPQGELTEEPVPDLPMLTVTLNTVNGMGDFNTYAYDISELVNVNPWTEDAELSTLPVYRNPRTAEKDEEFPTNDSFQAIKAVLPELADRLGLDMEQIQSRDSLDMDGISAWIYFPGISLPGVPLQEHLSYEDAVTAAEYLKENYADLFGMENPTVKVTGGNYDRDLTGWYQYYSIRLYDSGGDLTEQILNYNFNYIEFYVGSEGLDRIDFYALDTFRGVAEYPIVSAKEAEELLLDGKYIGRWPANEDIDPNILAADIPERDQIKRVELVYCNWSYDKYTIPFYKFYVERPWDYELPDGMEFYDEYYVPAVEQQYVSNLPANVNTHN